MDTFILCAVKKEVFHIINYGLFLLKFKQPSCFFMHFCAVLKGISKIRI